MTQRLKLPLGMMLLLMGGMTYLLFRPQTLLMFHVTDALGLSAVINSMREGISSQLPEFPGTFDVADLLCYLVPYLLYMSITLKIKRI